jgi:hypothetical protein
MGNKIESESYLVAIHQTSKTFVTAVTISSHSSPTENIVAVRFVNPCQRLLLLINWHGHCCRYSNGREIHGDRETGGFVRQRN